MGKGSILKEGNLYLMNPKNILLFNERRDTAMKKPVKEYETDYEVSEESETYYGNCESCNKCNDTNMSCGLINR